MRATSCSVSGGRSSALDGTGLADHTEATSQLPSQVTGAPAWPERSLSERAELGSGGRARAVAMLDSIDPARTTGVTRRSNRKDRMLSRSLRRSVSRTVASSTGHGERSRGGATTLQPDLLESNDERTDDSAGALSTERRQCEIEDDLRCRRRSNGTICCVRPGGARDATVGGDRAGATVTATAAGTFEVEVTPGPTVAPADDSGTLPVALGVPGRTRSS